MKLSYWYSRCPNDSDAYSVRMKTRRGALEAIARSPDPETWPVPRKVTVEYRDSFDLMTNCVDEGRLYWEA